MERLKDPRELDEEGKVHEFARMLSDVTGERISIAREGDTYEIDTDSFQLSFVLNEGSFEIRNIRTSAAGIGSKVIRSIHEFCDENGLGVHASNVRDTARGFWENMGYEEGAGDEFFRAGSM